MKILNFAIGRNNSGIQVSQNNQLKAFQPKLKVLTADTVSFKGANKADAQFLKPEQVSEIAESFTKELISLRESGKLDVNSAKNLIKTLLPGKNVEVLPIEDIVKDIPQIGNPKEQSIFGVFNPVLDKSGNMKFKIYYDFSSSGNSSQNNIKKIAQVHEFIHLLQANTEQCNNLTKNALQLPSMAMESYEQMNNMFHAVEYQLYMNSNQPVETYPNMIKDFVDSYYTRSDTPSVLKFFVMSSFNEAQAHCESLKCLQKNMEPDKLAADPTFKIVMDTVPIYKNMAEASLKVLKERDNILKDRDRIAINYYETQLNLLTEDYNKIST